MGATEGDAGHEEASVWREAFREEAMHAMLLMLPLEARLACRTCCRNWRRDISAAPALFRRLELAPYPRVDDAALKALLAWSCPAASAQEGDGVAQGAQDGALRGSEVQYLDATGCTGLTGAGVATALSQSGCPQLRCLKLGGVPLSLNALRSIFAACPALEEMEVDMEGLRIHAAKELAGLLVGDSNSRACVAVRTLRIRPATINMGINGAAALGAALKTNWRLQALVLAKNNLRPEGVTSIAAALAAPSSCSLRMLDLSSNSMGDAGAFALASALPEARSLWVLRAAGNDLSQSACWAVAAAALAAQNVRVLDLRGNDGHYADKVVREVAQALASGTQAASAGAAASAAAGAIVPHGQQQSGGGDSASGSGAGGAGSAPGGRLLGLPPPLMVLDGVPIRAIVDNSIGETLALTPEALEAPVKRDSRLRLLLKTAGWLPAQPAVPIASMRSAFDMAEVLAAALGVNTSLKRLDLSSMWAGDEDLRKVEAFLTAMDTLAAAADANPGLHLQEVVLWRPDSKLAKERRLAFWPAPMPRFVVRNGLGVPLSSLPPPELAERVAGALCSYAAQLGKAPSAVSPDTLGLEVDESCLDHGAAGKKVLSACAVSGLLGTVRTAARAGGGAGGAFLEAKACTAIVPAAAAAVAVLANGRRWLRRMSADPLAVASGIKFPARGAGGADKVAEDGAGGDEAAAAAALGGVLASAVARGAPQQDEQEMADTLDSCISASDSLSSALAPLTGGAPAADSARDAQYGGLTAKSIAPAWQVPAEEWHAQALACTGGALSFHMGEAASRVCGVALAVLLATGPAALGDATDLRRLARCVAVSLTGMCKSALRNKPLAVQGATDVLRLLARLVDHEAPREALLGDAGVAHLLARGVLTLHGCLPPLANSARLMAEAASSASDKANALAKKKKGGHGHALEEARKILAAEVVMGPQAMGVYETERACRAALAALSRHDRFLAAVKRLRGCGALCCHGAAVLTMRIRPGEAASEANVTADKLLDAACDAFMLAANAADAEEEPQGGAAEVDALISDDEPDGADEDAVGGEYPVPGV